MNKLEKNVRRILEEVILDCDANYIAFSGGLDSSIIAQIKRKQDLNAITIITKDFLGTDLAYAQIMGKHIEIPLELKFVNLDEIFDAIKNTIKILKNFNDIEIRNSIVSYLYLNSLKEKNVKKVITGDGADEVFAGYNFLIKKDSYELQMELKRLKKIMHFTSEKIANKLGLSIQMPFINKSVIELSETLTIEHFVNQKNNIKFGKWILRKAFENELPHNIIWREKTPMQDGSGTSSLTKMFESVITDDIFQEKIGKIKNEDDVIIRTKESLYYYELYRENFKIPEYNSDRNRCIDCKSEITTNSKFCRMCGKFPI